ncbi:MAG: UDP-N-acetylmuramate dehydrogenase [Candidatus Omnitrophota bacterium]
MNWLVGLKGKIKHNEPLNNHTSFKIGGRAAILFEPKDTEDLIDCLKKLKKRKIRYFVIGNGTNVLIGDSGFNGVVIKLSSKFFRKISKNGKIVTAGAGVNLGDLIKYLSKTKFSGYESLVGIPGSLAGALVMNAGIIKHKQRKCISDIVYKVKVLDKNCKVKFLTRRDCGFNYRRSGLGKYIILEAHLKFKKDKDKGFENRIKNFLVYRSIHHDYSKPNAGCIFKNPSKQISAGKLIEDCGFKGFSIGGAMVSKRHANFILNFNRATANDVIKLINRIKRRVKDKFGIKLKEEIKIV